MNETITFQDIIDGPAKDRAVGFCNKCARHLKLGETIYKVKGLGYAVLMERDHKKKDCRRCNSALFWSKSYMIETIDKGFWSRNRWKMNKTMGRR